MKADEVRKLISELEQTKYSEDDLNGTPWEHFRETIQFNDGGDSYEYKGVKFEPVKSYRQNSAWIIVFKIDTQYYRIIGHYDSWNGVEIDWSEIEEVVPKEKTITVYE